FPLPAPANDVAVGDVNGDGKLEVLAVDTNASALYVMQRTSDGRYVLSTSVTVGGEPVSVAVADIHGTGKLDVIVANRIDGSVSILHFPDVAQTLSSTAKR